MADPLAPPGAIPAFALLGPPVVASTEVPASVAMDGPPDRSPFPIVGIGSSSGGLKALSGLLAELPGDIGMAFVVIQHLDPTHESQLPSLLGRDSRLAIEEAVDGVEVRANHVYVITPNTRVGIEHGVLRISPREPGLHLGIDLFLRSLAHDQPGNAIGVILSGSGSDGTLGLAAIKAAQGITFAQDDTAEYTGMPSNAIANGDVDFVLSPAGIAKELGKVARFGFPTIPPRLVPETGADERGPADFTLPPDDPEHYAIIMGLLLAATGVDFTHYRTATIIRRTMRRMSLISRSTLAEYARYLAETPGEIDALARDVLINVTSFFRDQGAFAALKSVVFPALTLNRAAESPIRIWIAGCSTGQEVYSLAIELMEHLKDGATGLRVQIFATDISDWALAKARLGWYPDTIADEIPADRLARYFTREASGFRVAKSIRDLCVFAKHDVTVDVPFSRIDLITCRNVLIYLGPVLQKHVLPTLHFSLRPRGFLLLGSSETLGRASGLYETVDEKHRLYRSIPSGARTHPPLALPLRAGERGNPPQPATQSAPPVSDIQRAADQVVLGRFAPPGVLITEAFDIIQFRGRTTPYLEPAQGEASLNLLTMVPFAVGEALRGALDEARRQNLPVSREHVAHRRDHSFREIAFEVIPIKLPTGVSCFLVLFAEQADAPPTPPPSAPQLARGVGATNPAELTLDQRELAQLRVELAAATDYVHSLVELNHGLAEQIKESREEAQSSTEEFRSTNEELQTTKEEIESTNQELVTINDELRAANDDLGKALSALRISGELTSAIVETMRYPLLVLDANLKVESANRAFLEGFGVHREETLGRLVYDLGDGQWDIPELRRLLEDILPNSSAFDDFEVTHDFRHIGRRTMLLNGRRLSGGRDRSPLIVLVIADITERTRVARELVAVSDELRRSNAELDQFAAVTSHDLKDPLRMMSSFIGLLQSRYGALLDERGLKFMTIISDSARRMSEMIDAILTYSRVGNEVVELTVSDSAGALKDALVNLKDKIEEAQGTIVEDPLPQVPVSRPQLTQLFQNLVGNSLKYRSEQRPVVIRISAQECAHEWIFTVADNGIGIAEPDHQRVFQLFQRAHTDRIVRGTGIGLATCRKIVERHRGRIWVESEPEVGTTVSFALPKPAP